MNPILRFEDVSFFYSGNHSTIIHGLSLEIPQGEITAILGPNGAGKTTLLHLALGWLKPQSGQIMLAGKPLGSWSRRELGQRLGLVPQSEFISFDFSLLEYVLLGRAPYLNPLEMPSKVDLDLAQEALQQVGLSPLTNRSALNLSGGERQLLLIARAIAQKPRVMLLDEPSSHLDLGNKVRLLHLLKELSEQGVSILFTTHEADLVSALASHLILVRDGRVQDTGPLTNMMTSQKLSELYGTPIKVAEMEGKRIALWG